MSDGRLNQDEIDDLLGFPKEKRNTVNITPSFINQGMTTGRTDSSKENISNIPKTSAETKMCPVCKTYNTMIVQKTKWNGICGPGSAVKVLSEFWQCLNDDCGIRFGYKNN